MPSTCTIHIVGAVKVRRIWEAAWCGGKNSDFEPWLCHSYALWPQKNHLADLSSVASSVNGINKYSSYVIDARIKNCKLSQVPGTLHILIKHWYSPISYFYSFSFLLPCSPVPSYVIKHLSLKFWASSCSSVKWGIGVGDCQDPLHFLQLTISGMSGVLMQQDFPRSVVRCR